MYHRRGEQQSCLVQLRQLGKLSTHANSLSVHDHSSNFSLPRSNVADDISADIDDFAGWEVCLADLETP